jgi:hypothetical protein
VSYPVDNKSARCPWSRSAVVLLALALLIAGFDGGAGATAPGETDGALTAPDVPTPLATSVQTSNGTWATIPMGRLDEPLNTFWQLFYRPNGPGPWSNQVEATATATNGGLVLASAGPSLLVGVRPSVNLTFTPLISTSNGGRSWSDGLVPRELAARPAALATTTGHALALVNSPKGAQVLADIGGISKWRNLVTVGALARSKAGKSCGLGTLTSLSYQGARPLVGGSCSHGGVVGLFVEVDGTWRLAGPTLPSALDNGRAEVLGLWTGDRTTMALIAVADATGTNLLAAWSLPGGGWAASVPQVVGQDEAVASFGAAEGNGIFVLLEDPSGAEQFAVAQHAGTGWRQLPPPPRGTATVAFAPGLPADALVASGTSFSVWALKPASNRWSKAQVINVPLQYGSSS